MKPSPESDLIRTRHMIDAISEALNFIVGKNRESLSNDRMLTLALLKELELIGEAASRLSSEFKEKHSEIPWTLLVATRNRLVHGYFDINLDIVWKTVDGDLRMLLVMLNSIPK